MVAPPRDADRGLQTVRSATWPFWQKALPVLVAASYADVLRRCAGVGAVPAIQSLDRRLRSGVFDTIPLGLFEMREGRALLDALGADGRAAYLALYTSGSDVAFPLLLAALLIVPAPSAVRSLSCADRLGDLGGERCRVGDFGRALRSRRAAFGWRAVRRLVPSAWRSQSLERHHHHGTVHVEQIGRGPAVFTG